MVSSAWKVSKDLPIVSSMVSLGFAHLTKIKWQNGGMWFLSSMKVSGRQGSWQSKLSPSWDTYIPMPQACFCFPTSFLLLCLQEAMENSLDARFPISFWTEVLAPLSSGAAQARILLPLKEWSNRWKNLSLCFSCSDF